VYRTSTSLIGTELPGTVSLTVIELSDVPTTSGGAHFFGAPELEEPQPLGGVSPVERPRSLRNEKNTRPWM